MRKGARPGVDCPNGDCEQHGRHDSGNVVLHGYSKVGVGARFPSPEVHQGGWGAESDYLGHPWRMKSRVHPKCKTRYRVTNWREYERGHVQRGDVTIWLSPESVEA